MISVKCPVCASRIGGEVHTCERCDTPHHTDCWDYNGGCAIFACSSPEEKLFRNIEIDFEHLNLSIERFTRWCNRFSYINILAVFLFLGLLLTSFIISKLDYGIYRQAFRISDLESLLHEVEHSLHYLFLIWASLGLCKYYYQDQLKKYVHRDLRHFSSPPVSVLEQLYFSNTQRTILWALNRLLYYSSFLSGPSFLVLIFLFGLLFTTSSREAYLFFMSYTSLLLFTIFYVLYPLRIAHDNLFIVCTLGDRLTEFCKTKNSDSL